MIRAIKILFNPLLKLSITAKFAIMMLGFMLILAATIVSTFWTTNMQKDDAKVINIAGRQRMLSQKVAKEVMALIKGNTTKNEVIKTANLFGNSLDWLISGNEGKEIPPTEEENIRNQLLKVKRIWSDYRLTLSKLADINDERNAAYNAIIDTNLLLLNDMNDAVFMMEQEKLNARTINLAGRQRMLSQKMSKEVLLLEAGKVSAKDLLQTIELFDKSLGGLINGSEELGLKAMNNAAILSQLRKVEERWSVFRENTEKLINFSEPSKNYVTTLLTSSTVLLKEMNIAVVQYEEAFSAKVTYLKGLQLLLLIMTLSFFGIGWFFVTNPIVRSFSAVSDDLSESSTDIESVTGEINEGVISQTDIVQSATKDLENMIINIIQGSITLSVEKQAEISKAFSDFLKNFVERTSAEIAMGMMSVSQQSSEARKGIEDFISEIDSVEKNIKAQEKAIEEMVVALKSIGSTNEEIKVKARVSTNAADKATSRAFEGQERIEHISGELKEIRNSSEGIRDVTSSLATITESIKILALNMSLKVEDIKDDTGKSYGFEAMSAKVQQLAEEVEELLASSRELIIPTIEGIEKLSSDAIQAKELITEVTKAIKAADDESRLISERIERQATGIDTVEIESENLKTLAHNTTLAVEAQSALAKDIDLMLKDTAELIDTVSSQTSESVEGARKINEMMGQLRGTVINIENGTGDLAEKSTEISDMFNSIMELANRNRGEAKKLDIVTTSVRDVSKRLSDVVNGVTS
ncbi:MAG: type IV pili methyl-accepting chemotaxis transducer N-terminal domain-containing protein [Deltaproteobacteria bacterium]|nr:type IV pili methyl-accepting chemotaxis transducer N-terminal domain-containing protein [Deltaproteobacteria bacterium]